MTGNLQAALRRNERQKLVLRTQSHCRHAGARDSKRKPKKTMLVSSLCRILSVLKRWLLWIGFRHLRYAPDVQHRGKAVKGLKRSKADSQKDSNANAHPWILPAVLGHRSSIIIELLNYRSLLHIVHDYVF